MGHRSISIGCSFPVLAALLALSLLHAAAATAQIPNGEWEIEFPAPEAAVYQFQNISDCAEAEEVDLEICADIDLQPSDARGRYAGAASLSFDGLFQGTLVGAASASIKGRNGTAKAKLDVETSGVLMFPGIGNFDARFDLKCNRGGVSSAGLYMADCRGRIKVKGSGSQRFRASFDQQLEGGSWTFTMNPVPRDLRSFEGTARDSFGGVYLIEGRYDARRNTSKIDAKGLRQTTKGARVQMKRFDNETGEADAKYRVQGYRGRADVTAEQEVAD